MACSRGIENHLVRNEIPGPDKSDRFSNLWPGGISRVFLQQKWKEITSLCIKKCSVVAENVMQVLAMTTVRCNSSKLSTSSWKDRICSGRYMKKLKCWNLAIPEFRDWTPSPSPIYNVIKTKILVNILVINSLTNYLYFETRCKNLYVKLRLDSARHLYVICIFCEICLHIKLLQILLFFHKVVKR
jgi:hypothetical protein